MEEIYNKLWGTFVFSSVYTSLYLSFIKIFKIDLFSLEDAEEEQDDAVFTSLWEGHVPSNIFQDGWEDRKILIWG